LRIGRTSALERKRITGRMRRPKNEREALEYFSSEARCRAFLLSRRWPNDVTCPQCGSKLVYPDSSRGGWECKNDHRRRKFTLKTGTVFEDSALSWRKWLLAIWMVANRKSVGSHELARAIGVTQKTGWLMLLRIRLASHDDPDAPKAP
jgi:transposase-like protein